LEREYGKNEIGDRRIGELATLINGLSSSSPWKILSISTVIVALRKGQVK
jgi:hypothetical protein